MTIEDRSRPLRILHVFVGLGLGGMEKQISRLLVRLDRTRFSVEVVCLKGWGPVGDFLKRSQIPVTVLNGGNPWSIGFFFRLARFFGNHSFDIVHSHLLWANLLAVFFRRRNRVVWHEHDTDEWMGGFLKLLEKLLIGRGDRFVAISEAVAECLKHRHPVLENRIRVIRHGLTDVPRKRLPSEEKALLRKRFLKTEEAGPLIGFVGRLDEPKKGLSVLLRAARHLVGISGQARFLIVGDGPARASLTAQAESLGLESRVFFVGNQEDVGPYYDVMDIFVLPSLWEGFGVVLLEAMGASLPVVATRVGGIPEVVVDGETGILVAPGDAEALTAALVELLSNGPKREEMGRKGVERVLQKFRMESVVRLVSELYGEVVRV